MADQLTFEQMCVRKQTGYICDAKSLVNLKDPLSYDDVIFKVTTKCETSLLLMKSHHGNLDYFGVDILPIVDSRSPFQEDSLRNSDISKVRETWEVLHDEGYHGTMAVGKIDINSMPKNECRTLHQLPQFVNSLIHSLEAYFMFQKPNKAFLPNALNLWEPVENDQTERFLVILAWKFLKHPSVSVPSSPLIEMKSSPFKGLADSILAEDQDMDDDENVPVPSPLLKSKSSPFKGVMESVLSEDNAKGAGHNKNETIMSKSSRSLLTEGSPIRNQKENILMKGGEVTRTVTSSSKTTVTKKVLSPVKQKPLILDEDEIEATENLASRKRSTQKKAVVVPVDIEIETTDNTTSRKRSTQKAKATVTAPAPSKRGRRGAAQPSVPVEEEVEEDNDEDEVSFKKQPEPILKPKNSETVKVAPTPTATEMVDENAPMMSVDDIELPFEKSFSKPSAGRKSGAAGRKSVGGRKSLLPEWPQEEQKETLTFFDNLNPAQTEATRVNLTCKYATMLYDRELSSKQFYMWEQKKGREVNKTNQKMSLDESEEKDAVVDFFKSLSEGNSEQQRVSFTIKYFQGQYNLSITSKQLYAWLSAKGKKVTTKRR